MLQRITKDWGLLDLFGDLIGYRQIGAILDSQSHFPSKCVVCDHSYVDKEHFSIPVVPGVKFIPKMMKQRCE